MANEKVSPRSEGVWVIIYAPGEHDLEVFMGAGAEEAARKRYAIAKLNWTCRLLCEAACSQTVAPVDPEHPEDFCMECKRPNIVWHADSPIWNLVMRRGDAPEPILCPACFGKRAISHGIESWKLIPDPILYPAAPAVSTPRCPRCGSADLALGANYVTCDHCETPFRLHGFVRDFAQFFQPEAQTLPEGESK